MVNFESSQVPVPGENRAAKVAASIWLEWWTPRVHPSLFRVLLSSPKFEAPLTKVNCVIPFLASASECQPKAADSQPASQTSRPLPPPHTGHHPSPKKSTGQWVTLRFPDSPSISFHPPQSNPSSKSTKVTLPFRLHSPSPFYYHFPALNSLPYDARRGKAPTTTLVFFSSPFLSSFLLFPHLELSTSKIPIPLFFPLSLFLWPRSCCSPKQVPPSAAPVVPAFFPGLPPHSSVPLLAPIAVCLYGRCCCCFCCFCCYYYSPCTSILLVVVLVVDVSPASPRIPCGPIAVLVTYPYRLHDVPP